MPRTKKLSVEEKVKILTLSEEKLNNCAIGRRIGCSETTVRNVIKKYSERENFERKSGSGSVKKTSPADERVLKFLSLRNRFASASELREELEQSTGVKISTRTTQRRLNELGLHAHKPAKKPLLTKAMKEKRLQWAKEHKNWTLGDWAKVIFSDESKFNLIGPDGRGTVRRRKGERYSDECLVPTVKHSPYVMVWGAITSRGVGRIITLQKSVDAKEYKKILRAGLVPTLEELSAEIPDFVFQDDSAPCHRALSIKIYKEKLGLVSLKWPGNSPDLNPIENVWSIMGKKIRESRPSTLPDLKTALEQICFNEINSEYIQKLYESMPRRVQAVITAKGGNTKY